MPEPFPPAHGISMELLTERGLNRAFIKVVGEHCRDGRPVVTRREGKLALLPADELTSDVKAARERIAQLDAEIHSYEHPFSGNETPR